MCSRYGSRIAAASLCLTFLTSPIYGQLTQPQIRARVRNLVISNNIILPQPEFDWSRKTMYYVIPYYIRPSVDATPFEVALAEQLRVEAIRKYRMTKPDQVQFWTPILKQAESKISEILNMVQPVGNGPIDFSPIQNSIDEIYKTNLNTLAIQRGKTGATVKSVYTALYSIQVAIRPQNGRIRYMAEGRRLVYRVQKNQEPPLDNPEWLDGIPGGDFQIGEVTCFLATWENGVSRSTIIASPAKGKMLVADINFGFRWE